MTKLIFVLALVIFEIEALDLFSKHRILKDHEPKLIKIDIEHQKHENHPNHRNLTQIHRDAKENYKIDKREKPQGKITHHSQIPSNLQDSPHLISLTAYHRDQHGRPYENSLLETFDEVTTDSQQGEENENEDDQQGESDQVQESYEGEDDPEQTAEERQKFEAQVQQHQQQVEVNATTEPKELPDELKMEEKEEKIQDAEDQEQRDVQQEEADFEVIDPEPEKEQAKKITSQYKNKNQNLMHLFGKTSNFTSFVQKRESKAGVEQQGGGSQDQWIRNELTNVKDIEYLGKIYIGSPHSQMARVVFDTGSDWLTIKSCLTEAHCHKKKVKAKKAGDNTTEDEPYDEDDPASKGILKADTVYYMNQTQTGSAVNNIGFPLSYGSANLEGFKFQDYVCLLPLSEVSTQQSLAQKNYDEHFCVKDLRFQSIITGNGLEMADGILGLSPKNYGRHSLLPELKISGLIDRTIVSFSNAFLEGTKNFNQSHDQSSYVIFGGLNKTQIVGGEQGLHSMELLKGQLNPTMYWGVTGRGFKYGNAMLMDPEEEDPILAVIDSGTTLMILPQVIFDKTVNEIAKKMKNDHEVNMICTRAAEVNDIEVCYFNNTKCDKIHQKLDPIKFVFDQSVFELNSRGYLKDDINHVEETDKDVPACVIDMRSGKDKDHPEDRRFLMGNTFLKNYYSVYDYDWQHVRLGVNIHSKSLAKAKAYQKGNW